MSQLLDYEVEAMGEYEKLDMLDEALQVDYVGDTSSQLPTNIHGPKQLQQRLRKLLGKFKECFRTSVSKTSAKIRPFSFTIDETKWNTSRSNNTRYRTQSALKNAEIDRQVQLLLDLKVIKASRSERYSQVHLVPKPDNKWRFCLDYRFLNSCTTMEGGVIPMIYELLQRIGRKKPKFFAVIDFTSGYHQAPIAKETIPYTAFITHRGVYEWVRLPMGLKGAPSYFQREVASILGGLIGVVCELYLDDLIIFATTEDEFIENLNSILERLQEHNITCNPDKCKFGIDSVEYVGHVIDSEGLNFSAKKKGQVYDFPLPTLIKELYSFLGLVNYFGEHLRDLTTALSSLRQLLAESKIKRKLEWTPSLKEDFQAVKDMVNNLPKLYFVNDTDPVIVFTDASDFGIGAYICQMVQSEDGRVTERPIAFMSKSLSTDEKKWTTIEKECYAIYQTFRKFEYLLRDIKFTLKTDHANLLYMNIPPSTKVLRWKLAIQEFDCDVEHLAGIKNIVADGFSRLPDNTGTQQPIGKLAVLTRRQVSEHRQDNSTQQQLNEEKDSGKITEIYTPLSDETFNLISKVHNSWRGHRGIAATVDELQKETHYTLHCSMSNVLKAKC
jgi:hypothetical protein